MVAGMRFVLFPSLSGGQARLAELAAARDLPASGGGIICFSDLDTP
jgi:hypothetical protein